MSESTIIGFNDPKKWRSLSCDTGDEPSILKKIPGANHEFKFRIASSDNRRTAATVLVRKMYSWRGYEPQGPAPKRPDELVLIAENRGEPVATMTVCVDGPAGLPADENFRDQTDRLRAAGRRLWEPSRVAVVSRMPKRVFAGLMHIGLMYAGILRECTDAVIEVNPRHVRFYTEMLGFKALGVQRLCTRVGAPGVLLRLEMSHAIEKIKEYERRQGESPSPSERTFYSYCFLKKDITGILNRLSHECL